ncbi:SusC/RagA family TonB-linked outer membrane protein [Sphingobacterium paludis]|uniref:TonB-linked SusC/RagA family outer membrane protein n=1 Tax=Sphingobacterium paludis TaxID=1476465 RepID=A0A4R7CZB0_9SPHI|nr:TonB-dependent receptor [Sphingobacterium paludis]TDS13953.1 TonB-linked SusC/RagA family outer membrane protein [Sphingobacterium paludis]
MKQKLLSFIFVLTCLIGVTYAQNRQVTGKVTSATDGSPISGVSVAIQGTSSATQTDQEGNYSLSISGQVTLSFTSIGFVSQNIETFNRNIVNAQLVPDQSTLDEVIVVGYGEQNRTLSTQSVSTIKAESFKNTPIQTPQQILQGQAAGVNMVNSSGVLGAEAQITVRGGSSLSAGGRPLYVIDGVPLNSAGAEYTQTQGGSSGLNPLLNINSSDIESVTVLKDAAAVAIYGSRGSNGVILIKTKSGASGKTKINVDYFNGFSHPTADIDDMMNAQEWIQFRSDYLRANGATVPNFPTTSFDWLDAAVRTGKVNNIAVNAQGGDEKTRFYLGGNYSKETGFTISNAMDRLAGKISLDHNVSDKFKVGVNYNLSRVDMDRINSENSTYAPLTAAYLFLPYVTPYDENGEFVNTGFIGNFLAIDATGINKNYSNRQIGNAYAEWEIFEGLKAKTDFGIDNYGIDEKYREADILTPGGYAYRTHNTDNKWLNTSTLNYNKRINDLHNVGALLGYSYETAKLTQLLLEGSGFASDDLPNVGSASTPITTSEEVYEWALQSMFARANYGYADKYLVEGSFRRDGSSRFGPNRKYGNFFAVSGGWVISNENFFNKDNAYIQSLKLTASYGTSGNDGIGFYNYYGTFAGGNDYMGGAGLVPFRVANRNLSWEETAQFDLGLSARLFNRIDFQFNFYNKNTTGLLSDVPYPYTTGFPSASQNVGEMRNRGFEFAINSENIKRENFSWTTSFNIGFNKNTVLSLPVNPDEDGRNFLAGNTEQRAIEGYSRNSFYLIRYKGINQQTGEAEWFAKDGSTTTAPTAADRVIVGKADPNFQGGITNTLRYKNLDFSAFFNFSYGNDVYLDGIEFTDNFASGSYNKSRMLLDYWRQPGDNAYAPALNSDTRATFAQTSTKNLFDGSYLRLKTVQFGYTFPTELLSRTNFFSSARVYFLAQNIWTVKAKDFRGDPEISANGASNLIIGQTFFALPQPKTFTFGVNFGF